MIKNNQMELELTAQGRRAHGRRRAGSPRRAQWWFAHMRTVVAGAMEWPARGGSADEQISLGLVAKRS